MTKENFSSLVSDLGGAWRGDKLFRVRVVVVDGLGLLELGHKSKRVNQGFKD